MRTGVVTTAGGTPAPPLHIFSDGGMIESPVPRRRARAKAGVTKRSDSCQFRTASTQMRRRLSTRPIAHLIIHRK